MTLNFTWVSLLKITRLTANLPNDFIEVATSGRRVGNQETDCLLGVNDKDGADLTNWY